MENCTRLEELRVETFWEVSGIERLEHMQNLKRVELRAEEGSFIERCIRMIQKWPDEIMICAPAIADAASLVHSLLSPSLVILASISNQHIISKPRFWLEEPYDDDYIGTKPPNPKLDIELMSPSSCGSIMFCFVIDCVSVSSELTVRVGLIASFPKFAVYCHFSKVNNVVAS
ncbi:hypothetical protein SUGI_0560210 [Cryptomeria japonica]|nr:hypothetical protein SUGI_0560210 [Cryptomeria japonica]